MKGMKEKQSILSGKFLHLEAVDGPDAADADLLRLMRWEARGKPATNFYQLLRSSFNSLAGLLGITHEQK